MTPDEIRAMLKRHGLSQAEAARRLGVTQQTLNRWVTGTRSPRLPIVVDKALRDLDKRLTAQARRRAASAERAARADQ
jgi:transcriptional regulator with XRE-family HTH domain